MKQNTRRLLSLGFVIAILAISFGTQAQDTDMSDTQLATATFAGGCFWCLEPPFHQLEGVHDVIAGFTGGQEIDPTYKEVVNGQTGHRESAQVTFDPSIVSYEDLLYTFWRNIDPTDEYGQFADRGSHYETAIFFHDDEQKRLAEISKRDLETSGKFDKPIVTDVLPVTVFYKAEDYHQDYYKTNPLHYNAYKKGSGREGFIKKTWVDEK
jgi:peptide methionine sulfoxide reductase msrA/msrB